MTYRLLDLEAAIDRSHATFFTNHLATRAALGTRRRIGRLHSNLTHLPCLNLSAELLPQLMGASLDDGVMRNPHNGAVGTIQSDRNFRRLVEESIKFFLERRRCSIHALPPSVRASDSPEHQHGDNLPKNPQVLPLTFLDPGVW